MHLITNAIFLVDEMPVDTLAFLSLFLALTLLFVRIKASTAETKCDCQIKKPIKKATNGMLHSECFRKQPSVADNSRWERDGVRVGQQRWSVRGLEQDSNRTTEVSLRVRTCAIEPEVSALRRTLLFFIFSQVKRPKSPEPWWVQTWIFLVRVRVLWGVCQRTRVQVPEKVRQFWTETRPKYWRALSFREAEMTEIFTFMGLTAYRFIEGGYLNFFCRLFCNKHIYLINCCFISFTAISQGSGLWRC